MEQWLALSHVVVHFGHEQLTTFEQWFSEQRATVRAERRVDVISPSFGVTPHLVVGTQRIATMHTRHARLYEKLLPLRVIAPPPEFPTMRETMQWHQHLDTDPAVQWLVGTLTRYGLKSTPA